MPANDTSTARFPAARDGAPRERRPYIPAAVTVAILALAATCIAFGGESRPAPLEARCRQSAADAQKILDNPGNTLTRADRARLRQIIERGTW